MIQEWQIWTLREFLNFNQNSETFLCFLKIPWQFQDFQVTSYQVTSNSSTLWRIKNILEFTSKALVRNVQWVQILVQTKLWNPCVSYCGRTSELPWYPRKCIKAVLKSKLTIFWHISEGTFYRKHIKFVGTRIFTIEIRLVFFVFQ